MKYTITHVDGIKMPNQLYGITSDGQHFYFRGRGGGWELNFGVTEDDAIFGAGFFGDYDKAGWFEREEWKDFFWEVVGLIESGKAERHGGKS